MTVSQNKAIVRAYFDGVSLDAIHRLFKVDINTIIEIVFAYLTAPINKQQKEQHVLQ